MRLFLLLFLTISCGKVNHEVTGLDNIEVVGIPDSITLKYDYESAAKFCDDRYGRKTSEAETCFITLINIFNPTLKFDFSSVDQFCEDNYTNEEEMQSCKKDSVNYLLNLFKTKP